MNRTASARSFYALAVRPSAVAAFGSTPRPTIPGKSTSSLTARLDRPWSGRWPTATFGHLDARHLGPDRPLVKTIGVSDRPRTDPSSRSSEDVEPAFFITVGSREASAGPAPGHGAAFNEFFDNPPKRPSRSYSLTYPEPATAPHWTLGARVRDHASSWSRWRSGRSPGGWRLTPLEGSRLIQVEAVVKTDREKTAYPLRRGPRLRLARRGRSWPGLDAEGRRSHRGRSIHSAVDRPLAVRHREITAQSAGAALACIPPPHQFFFPRDYTDNVRTAWFGRGHLGLEPRYGFGIRQDRDAAAAITSPGSMLRRAPNSVSACSSS